MNGKTNVGSYALEDIVRCIILMSANAQRRGRGNFFSREQDTNRNTKTVG